MAMDSGLNYPWELPTPERLAWYQARRERADKIRRGLAEIPIGSFKVKEFRSLLRFMRCDDFNLFEEKDFEILELKIAEFTAESTVDRLRRMFCCYCGRNIKDDLDHRC